jgi:hypothetical protein
VLIALETRVDLGRSKFRDWGTAKKTMRFAIAYIIFVIFSAIWFVYSFAYENCGPSFLPGFWSTLLLAALLIGGIVWLI